MENFVFRDGEDWQNNSLIRRHPVNEWIFYIEGYRIAAEKLIDNVLSTHEERDTLIYPILYLYRHYIEIQLKEIIQISFEFLDNKIIPKPTHDLFQLWLVAKNNISQIWISETNSETISSVEEIIKSVCVVDTKSDSFRYPINRIGEQTLKDMYVVNIREFKDKMIILVEFFDGISFALSVYLENKYEIKIGE